MQITISLGAIHGNFVADAKETVSSKYQFLSPHSLGWWESSCNHEVGDLLLRNAHVMKQSSEEATSNVNGCLVRTSTVNMHTCGHLHQCLPRESTFLLPHALVQPFHLLPCYSKLLPLVCRYTTHTQLKLLCSKSDIDLQQLHPTVDIIFLLFGSSQICCCLVAFLWPQERLPSKECHAEEWIQLFCPIPWWYVVNHFLLAHWLLHPWIDLLNRPPASFFSNSR